MKRLCILVTYDKENIIDAYIGYILKELKTVASHLVVVCNMSEIIRGQEYLEEYSDEIIFRENKGLDAGGFKETLCQRVGWGRVSEFDELVLLNDSFFGPFIPMQKIFAQMEDKKVDFWGLGKQKERRYIDNNVNLPEYIQSYFFVFRSEMLHSKEFRNYWEEMPYYQKYEDVVTHYERKITQYFAEKGFAYTCFGDMEPNDSDNINNTFCQYSCLPNELIRKRNFPVLKRRPLKRVFTNIQTQEQWRLAMDYIEKDTDYDVNLIWENIIRVIDISDLQRNLCLQYSVAGEGREVRTRERKVLISVCVEYENSIEYVLEYIEHLKDHYSIAVLSKKESLLDVYKNMGYTIYQSVDDVTNAVIREGYEYVCMIHDEDLSSDVMPSYHGKSLFYRKWENLLKNIAHIDEVLKLFEENPYLGALTLPEANFGSCFAKMGRGWDGKFQRIMYEAEKLGLEKQITAEKPPFALFDDYWMRGCILKEISCFEQEMQEAMPYLWGYVVQKAGYFSGIVESKEYAAMNEINLHYYLAQIGERVRSSGRTFSSLTDMKELLFRQALELYCLKHQSVYVYGTGVYAEKYKDLISNVKAYVVSDGQEKTDEWNGKKVRYLSEIPKDSNVGLVICLAPKNQLQVLPLLDAAGVVDYFCVKNIY